MLRVFPGDGASDTTPCAPPDFSSLNPGPAGARQRGPARMRRILLPWSLHFAHDKRPTRRVTALAAYPATLTAVLRCMRRRRWRRPQDGWAGGRRRGLGRPVRLRARLGCRRCGGGARRRRARMSRRQTLGALLVTRTARDGRRRGMCAEDARGRGEAVPPVA